MARTTTQRGLGWHHQKQRAKLLGQHRQHEGTRCWWCNKPMHTEAHRNWDMRQLCADHSVSRAVGGRNADRLLHATCNEQRGDGSRDHMRPALLAMSGGCPRNSLDWS